MISAEVQRTLVKSPPELWAELGDPASLARHLGELGEIRVTRIDPEQVVEWEAEDTTGTVLIKPSAWGTKVTLTVERQTPMAEPPTAAHPPAHADRNPEPQPAVETGSEPAAEAQAPAPATEPLPLEPAAEALAPGPAAVLPLAPAAEALAPGPAAVLPLAPAAEALAPGPAAVLPLAPALPLPETSQLEPEPSGQAEVTAAVLDASDPDPEVVQRRGFFSRLFGRRPRQASVQPQPTETGARASSSPNPPGAGAGQPETAEPVAAGELEHGEPIEPATSPEPTSAEPIEAAASPAPQPAQTPGPLASPPPEPAQPPEQVASVASALAEPPEPAAGQIEQLPESAGVPAQEISGRLEQGEEAAAGDVTAVLTAVLDRLGAAHHRPFSRG